MDVGTTVLSADLRQPDTPPVESLRLYAVGLLALGFTHDELLRMMVANPARRLGP